MMSLTIVGRLGADPVLGDAAGTPVLNMNVACDGWDPKAREKMTTWVRVSFFGSRAEKLAPHLAKGSSVAVSGEARLSEYKGKMYLELSASQVSLVGSKPAETRAEPAQPARGKSKSQKMAEESGEDDTPF